MKWLQHLKRISPYFFLLLFLCSSCGYRFANQACFLQGKTISVPYVIGDKDGYITRELVRALTASGYRYDRCGGDVVLRVEVLEIIEEDIGFRFERNEENKIVNSIISMEERLKAVVLVAILDSVQCCDLVEPFTITADVEFDHEYYSSPNDINEKSLGQLTDIDSARDAAMQPLGRAIAQRIVDYLDNAF